LNSRQIVDTGVRGSTGRRVGSVSGISASAANGRQMMPNWRTKSISSGRSSMSGKVSNP
jgi:hypothetical protein